MEPVLNRGHVFARIHVLFVSVHKLSYVNTNEAAASECGMIDALFTPLDLNLNFQGKCVRLDCLCEID